MSSSVPYSPSPSLPHSIPFSPISFPTSSLSTSSLERRFAVCVRWIQDRTIDFPIKPTTSQQLKFYGLYKQATIGDCTSPAPSLFNPVRRYMHAAHVKQKGKSRLTAMMEYLEKLDEMIKEVDFSVLNPSQRELADKFFREYREAADEQSQQSQPMEQEQEQEQDHSAEESIDRSRSGIAPEPALSPIPSISSPGSGEPSAGRFQDEDQASPVRISSDNSLSQSHSHSHSHSASLSRSSLSSSFSGGVNDTDADKSTQEEKQESKQQTTAEANTAGLTGKFDEAARLDASASFSAKLSSLQAANHEKLRQVEQHLLALVQKTQTLHTPQTASRTASQANPNLNQSEANSSAGPLRFSTPFTQRRAPATPFSAGGTAVQRVAQLQNELTGLLQSLEQRTNKQENQLRESEERWNQRLESIQRLQIDLFNKMQTIERRSEEAKQPANEGMSILGIASVVVPLGLAGWAAWKWVQEKKRK